MPNEQTSVPLFTAGEVLTAANMNISAGTGVPVFSNTTTRDAGFGGTGEKTLAEGQLCYLSSTNVVQYYDGAAWATVGPTTATALVLVKSQTIGTAVSSVAVTNAFSTTYDNYKIVVAGGVGSTNQDLQLKLGSTTTGYYNAANYTIYSTGATMPTGQANIAYFYGGTYNTNTLGSSIELIAPFLSSPTIMNQFIVDPTTTGRAGFAAGYLANNTSYTDFTLTCGSGTITGGTIYVYGYAKA